MYEENKKSTLTKVNIRLLYTTVMVTNYLLALLITMVVYFFDVPYYGVYRVLIIKNKNTKINTNFYVGIKEYEEFYFRIDNVKKIHLVTFKITDKFYNGLPIEDGSITLTTE